jgi:hypothetical protein
MPLGPAAETGDARPCTAAQSSRSIIGQIETYLELHDKQEAVGFPKVQLLKTGAVPLEEVIQALMVD